MASNSSESEARSRALGLLAPKGEDLHELRHLGFVYVLRSLSDDPEVKAVPDLHKIGFTTMSVAKRTGSGAQSATFPGAPVREVLCRRRLNTHPPWPVEIAPTLSG